MSSPIRYTPDPRHRALGADFFDSVEAASFPSHVSRYRNQRWAERVGLGALTGEAWLDHLGRFKPLPGNLPEPLALRYHGHQFRSYNPELGDGRGFLFAQLRDGEDGRLLDLGTKGSGRTPWSRGGDGRLTLKGGVREVLATAMLEALGVDTSKSLSLVETGESLSRGDEPSPARASVLVRLSHSHIRFGTFQRQAFLKRPDNIQTLLDYCIEQYFPELRDAQGAERAPAFLRTVLERSADLAASWMAAGFVHGVLNTDNLNVTGESFDYGPYRFLPTLDVGFTAAYFDHSGLYAYGRQPEAVHWNLTRLAEALLHVAEEAPLVAVLRSWEAEFDAAFDRHTWRRLGLKPKPELAGSDDLDIVGAVYPFLSESQIGFERFFFDWHGGLGAEHRAQRSPHADVYAAAGFEPVRRQLSSALPLRTKAMPHGYFDREAPTTLLIDEVESIWACIAERDDWSAFEAKLGEVELMRDALVCPPGE